MSNLNNLTSKIVEDASNKADSIMEEAKAQEKLIIDNKVKEAEKLKSEILEKAHLEAKNKKDRVISNAELQVRNEKLRAKQEVINKVMKASLETLSNMDTDKYLTLVKDYIIAMKLKDVQELIVPERYKEAITLDYITGVNMAIKASGCTGEVVKSLHSRDIVSGFILTKNGIDMNNSFETLLSYMRDDLEADIVKVLYNEM
ncbi:V-type ATP synthase subunit E [Desnuesiella massiliensis]|uniref:V-type ATP synthase subunit E n=1 Tax=Desnuesiella massiliensis TaxID=1650662 RepID=UPI0006E15BEC|nr:V-type ATP synthase subunit E family protein [Desnuesiella massiliensis]